MHTDAFQFLLMSNDHYGDGQFLPNYHVMNKGTEVLGEELMRKA